MKTTINNQEYPLTQAVLDNNLLHFLREVLNLTGVNNGCGIGACGACTILIDLQPIRACMKKVKEIVDKSVLTIEGMSPDENHLHPLQQAFIDAGAIQCGFCTPGMVLTAHALLLKNHSPTREEIRKALIGNLCRCTGYQQIIDAVEIASQFYQ